MENKISAGIITYNPNINKLKINIENIINQVECLLIIDNHSENIGEIQSLKKDYDRITIVFYENNKGVAYALNSLCQRSLELNYSWCLTLDQDSICPPNLIKELEKSINNNTAIIAPNIIYRGVELKRKNTHLEPVMDVDWVITSASLTNLHIWQELNGFDDWLFIDKVDYDYCVRAKKRGYKIIQDCNISIYHELGDMKSKKILWKIIKVTNHQAFRYYYMARNSVYLFYKFNENDLIIDILRKFVKISFFEKNKIVKIKAIFNGLIDGKKLVNLYKSNREID